MQSLQIGNHPGVAKALHANGKLTNRSLAAIIYHSDLDTAHRSFAGLAKELLGRQQRHFNPGQNRAPGIEAIQDDVEVAGQANEDDDDGPGDGDGDDNEDPLPDDKEGWWPGIVQKHAHDHLQSRLRVGHWY